ncbi:MAG: hypothetical protein JNL80_03220 [Phycisphaerae bacterium]|nr:hypothetical protein [Phycisphaerae bacterium]
MPARIVMATLVLSGASCGGGGTSDVRNAPVPVSPEATHAHRPTVGDLMETGAVERPTTSVTRPEAGAVPPAADPSHSADASPAPDARTSPVTRAEREREVLAEATKALADPRFSEFRTLAKPYLEVVAQMRPYDEQFAAGTITEEERAAYWELDGRKTKAWAAIHAHMFASRFTKADRKAMGQWLALHGQGPRP